MGLRVWLARLASFPLDVWDAATRRDGSPRPPRWGVKLVGGGDFAATGTQLFRILYDAAELRPDDDVLDLGCGFGRVAIPLADYLAPSASYRGVDVVPEAVTWCQRHIGNRHPNFMFQHADLANTLYNPGGSLTAAEYSFPFPDSSFSVVFAASLFTHMLSGGVAHYLGETARVLRPDGRLFATFFVLDSVAWELVHRPGHGSPFTRSVGDAFVIDPSQPEAAVAYREDDLRRMFRDAGLAVVEPIRYGEWSGREDGQWGQDMVLARRPHGSPMTP